jgi:pimeloyl-ACP methyl ester carboxylesterase
MVRPISVINAALAWTVFSIGALRAQQAEIGPPPGDLINIGGRRLHLYCLGAGSPTVILEAGGGAFALDWALVQPEIASTTRVCSYDRARYGWSDPSPQAETPESVAKDLHALLEAAHERPPFVLVGHSMGGIYVRIYERRFPSEVVGMVLDDPSHETDLFTMYRGQGIMIGALTAEQLQETIPSGNVQLPLRNPETGAPFDRLPGELYGLRVELERRLLASDASKPVPHAVVAEAVEGQRAGLAELLQAARSQSYPLGDRPVVVLTRGMGSSEQLRNAHTALAESSTNGQHIVVEGSGHEIHLYRPEVVIQAIRDVVESVRTGEQLPNR